MWDDIVKYLPKFSNPVLSAIDAAGFPYSVRCVVQVDGAHKLLRLEQVGDLPVQPGPASLLCHSHDERLWNMKSFVVRGKLRQDEQGWLFEPTQFIPGAGIGSPMDQFKALSKNRKSATTYLEKRGLARPEVDWDGIKRIWAEVKKGE